MRRAVFVLLAAAAPASAAFAEAPSPARRLFLNGVGAHVRGDDTRAERDWTLGLSLAAPGSDDALDCRLFLDMLLEERALPASAESAPGRREYRRGLTAYRENDAEGADRAWHACLTASKAGTRERTDCLMAMELLYARRAAAPRAASARPASPAPAAGASKDALRRASQTYLEGMIYYQQGDYEKARASWARCAAAASGSETSSDCRAGLEKLAQL